MRDIRDTDDLTAIRQAGTGFVHNRDGQILHAAFCAHLARAGPNRKLFAETRVQAEAYLRADPRRQWSTCPDCLGAPRGAESRAAPATPSLPPGARAELRTLRRGFEVCAPAYVPFEPRTTEQRHLRNTIRSRLRELRAGPGQVLHARLAGEIPRGADIENALLYNIDQSGTSIVAATAEGLRFEVDPSPPPGGVVYSYELAETSAGFACWSTGRTLAWLEACPLGLQAPKCTRLWWALKAGQARTATEALTADEGFAVLLDVTGPAQALRPEAVKALVDAVVCSFQAHGDRSSALEPADRIGDELGESTDEVLDALCRTDRAVLGVRERLVQPWGTRVQWLPDDHLCVAGDLRFRHGKEWSLAGEVRVVARIGAVSDPS